MTDPVIQHDAADGRYVALLDGEPIGELRYRDTDEGREFTHTGIEPAYEHRGYGTQLVREGLDDTRAAGLTPIGRCSMVAEFLAEHPEYAEPVR